MSEVNNDNLILIAGESSVGKSASLMNMKHPEGVMYLNCESGKKLPFKSKFMEYNIVDPYQVYEAFDHAETDPQIHTIVIDTATFLMEMFETLYVIPATDTRSAWGDYGAYWRNLMQQYVARSTKNIIVLAHTRTDYDEESKEYKTCVPVKGALKNQGIEAFFSQVVGVKKVPLKQLADYENDMLNITEDDKLVGYKHVFQTRLTAKTVGERIRAPMGMFTQKQTFMDNDAQLLLDHVIGFYK